MPDPSPTRRLAAIMFTDIVGSTALMAESEPAGLRAKQRHRVLVRNQVGRYHGQFIEAPGDETLSLFASALDAVSCALAIHAEAEAEPDLRLHIGVHSGDVLLEDGEVHGDGVNVASRVCRLSEGGGVCVSSEVYKSIRNQPRIEAVSLGEQKLKNVPEPVAVYSVSGTAAEPRPVSRLAPRRRGGARSIMSAFAGVVVIGVGAGWWLYRAVPSVGPIRSIAVLPLENLSGDPEQEYFADGMTEALIGSLAKIGSLRVTSRTSVMRFKQTRKPLREVAEELGVDALLEGTVLRDGDRVRITAQLIDARSDHHLWADDYERDLSGVIGLQREIASVVAEQVEARLTQEERRLAAPRPVVPAAHDEYLKGRYFAEKHTPAAALRARAHYEESMRLDPEYPLSYAGLADNLSCAPLHTWVVPAEGSDKLPTSVMDYAMNLATRAIELDENLPEAQTALGLVNVFREWDWDEAERRIEHAIEINPSFEFGHRARAVVTSFQGKLDDALRAIERARELDPLNPMVASLAGLIHGWRGDTETAMAMWREATELDAAHPLGLQFLGLALCRRGEVDEGLATLRKARETSQDDPLVVGDLGYCYAISGRAEEARALLQELEARSADQWVSPVSLARIHVGLGERDAALTQLERAYEVRAYRILEIRIDDRWDPIRDTPRFQDLLRRVGFPES